MLMTAENDPARSLEDVWRDILTRHGVSEAKAEDIVKLTFGTPALTRDIPDIDDVPDIVTDSRAKTDLEAHLDDDADPEQVRTQLDLALEDALRGTLSGPATVSDATLAQPFDAVTADSDSTGASARTGVGQPDKGAAWKGVDTNQRAKSDLSDENIETLANALEQIQEEHDLEIADLYAALERLAERTHE